MKIKFKYSFVNYFIIIIYFIIFNFGCKSNDIDNNSEVLMKAVFSKEFNKDFHICEKNEDELQIFNGTNYFIDFSFSKKNDCFKKITFSKLKFKYNINIPNAKNRKGIVLYKFENKDNLTKLYFLDLETNGVLSLVYSKKLKLLEVKSGAF